MARQHRLTRAELNEMSWEMKKKKKRTGNQSGSRSNPNQKKVEVAEQNNVTTTPRSQRKAIPLYLPGQDKPVIGKNETLNPVVTKSESTTPSKNQQNQDFVVVRGQLKTAEQLQEQSKARAKAAQTASKAKNKATSKAKATTSGNSFDVSKLGKAQLRLLEKAGVEPGKEAEFFAQLAAEKKAKKANKEKATPDYAEREDRRIKTRDYKAGRNTDYSATQAQAEKLLNNKKQTKKKELSGDELLDLWENTQW